jgi:hypothetical protein
LPSPGLHFGSALVSECLDDDIYETLPSYWMKRVENAECFAIALLLDIWAKNMGRRHALFLPNPGGHGLRAIFFNFAHILGGPHHTETVQNPTSHLYYHRNIYERVLGSNQVARVLSKIEEADELVLRPVIKSVPSAWRTPALEDHAISVLLKNKSVVRSKVEELTSKLFVC